MIEKLKWLALAALAALAAWFQHKFRGAREDKEKIKAKYIQEKLRRKNVKLYMQEQKARKKHEKHFADYSKWYADNGHLLADESTKSRGEGDS